MSFCRMAALAGLLAVAAVAGAAPTLDFSTAQIEFGFTPGPNTGSNPLDLRMDLTPGVTWTESMQVDMNHNVSMAGMPQGMPAMAGTMGMTMQMRNVAGAASAEGQHTITRTIETTTMTATMGGQTQQMPSGMLQGQTTTLVVDDHGRPVDMEAALQSMLSSAGSAPGGGDSPMMNQLCILPDRPVSVGDAWTMSVSFPAVPDAQMLMTNTLDSVDASGVAHIHSVSNLNIPTPVQISMGGAAPLMPGGMTIDRMTLTADSQIEHNTALNHVGNTTGTFRMEMASAMPAPQMSQQAAAPQTMTMTMSMDGTMQSTVAYGD